VRSLLILGALLAVTAVVRAEDIVAYETEGDAETSGSDPRIAALDEAFGRAVSLAIAELVAPDVRSSRKADLDRELTGRARLWVAKFTVLKDTTADDRRQLKVTVRVDRDKVRAKLAEMNVATMTAGEASKGRTVTVLLRINESGGDVRASYGASAEKDLPGLGALSSALRAGGMAVKRAPASGPAARADGELPLGDDEAEALATEAKTELAAIAGVKIGDAVPVRGIASSGVLVTANLRVIERRGKKLVGEGTATTAARGNDDAVIKHAVDEAIVGASRDVLPPARQSLTKPNGLFSGDDTPITEPGVVLVRLAPKTPWGIVTAELKYLQGAKGVQRAVLRRLSPGGWVIGVTTTESVDRIAKIAKTAPATDTSVKVTVVADVVELTLSGSP